MSFGISDTDRQLLDWVKDNKELVIKKQFRVKTGLYEDNTIRRDEFTETLNIFDRKVKKLEEEEEKEKPYFARVEKSVEANKSAINMLGGIISKNAIGAKNAREELKKAMKSAQELTQAMKLAQDKQQKEIIERMEAMRKEVGDQTFQNKMLLAELNLKQVQLNKRVNEVLDARSKVFTNFKTG